MLKLLGKVFKHAADYEDNLIAIGIAWFVGTVICTLIGFYFGTVCGSDHVVDFQPKDMAAGFKGGAIGFVIGVGIALWVTIQYPKATRRDDLTANGHH